MTTTKTVDDAAMRERERCWAAWALGSSCIEHRKGLGDFRQGHGVLPFAFVFTNHALSWDSFFTNPSD